MKAATIGLCRERSGKIVALRLATWLVCASVILSASGAHVAGAQTPGATQALTDSVVVTGTISAGRRHPVGNAIVRVREVNGSFADSVHTDSAGRYTIRMPKAPPSRTFLIRVDAPGFAQSISVIDAVSASHDFELSTPTITLAAVRVKATRATPSPPHFIAPDIGGLIRASSGGASGMEPPAYAGDVLGVAALAPGLELEKSASGRIEGITTMGLGANQTSITVDGGDVRGVRLPRYASVAAKIATTIYDPSVGGFSGAKIELVTTPGRNIGSRGASVLGTVNAVGGSPTIATTASGSASGYLVLDRVLFSSSADLTRSSSPFTTFDLRGDAKSGRIVVADSARAALVDRLDQFGITPLRPSEHATTNEFSTLNRVDFVSDSNHSVAVIGRLALDATSPYGSSPATVGRLFGDQMSTDAGLALERTAVSRHLAQESSLSFSSRTIQFNPSLDVPLLQISVPGELNGINTAQNVLAGSAGSGASASRTLNINGKHVIRWVTPDGHHHSDAGLSFHIARDTRDPAGNDLGFLSFDSLDAFATGLASAYSRVVNPVRASANVATASGFIGDQWVVRPQFSVQGGVRLDLNQFSIPSSGFNATVVDTALGLGAAKTGSSLDASPRLGATWDIPSESGPIAQFSLRGGVGRFVNDVRSDALLASALPFAGSTALRRLDCSGDNVPNFDWASLSNANAPTFCSDGTGPTPVNVIGSVRASDWKPPASWRGNIGGSVQFRRPWELSVDLLRSVTTRISSAVVENLTPSPVFQLQSEGGRPIYAQDAELAAGSAYGRAVPVRIRDDLSSVNYIVSDMRSSATQITVGAAYQPLGATSVHFDYAYTRARDRSRGLDGTTAGDPRVPEWAPSSVPAHVVTATAFRLLGTRMSMLVQGRLQSGARYTPLVSGDINGDGRLDDRAYVAGATDGNDAQALDIDRLVASAPSNAASCLRHARGNIAGRNSCVGPWTFSLDGSLYIRLGSGSIYRQSSLQINLLNVISGLDAAVHGVDGMHGWGGYGNPDNVLLTESGYDPATRTFSYHVNPAFGSVRASSAIENPFGVRIGFSIPLSGDPASQQLKIDALRLSHPSVDALTDRYVAEYPNVGFDILDVADSVGLSSTQRDSLGKIGRRFDTTMRTIWRPVAERIAFGVGIDSSAHIIAAARSPAAINYAAFATTVRELLDDRQLIRLPSTAKFVISREALQMMGRMP